MSTPQFQPFTITVATADDETYTDVSESDGAFTYRLDDPSLPLSVVPRVTVSLDRPGGKSGYYVARLNVRSPASIEQDGVTKVMHSDYAELTFKIHRDATPTEAAAHAKRVVAILQSGDIYAMLTELKSLR